MNLIKVIEKGLLGVIALLTIVATIQEIMSIYTIGRVKLARFVVTVYIHRGFRHDWCILCK